MRRKMKIVLTAIAVVAGLGFLIPEETVIPVAGATSADWNRKSFWYEPWGASGVHKGIDIFAPRGRNVLSAVPGIVIYRGELPLGGHVVGVLGPKWRVHYYAHLDEASRAPWFVGRGSRIGAVGTSGNARGKPPHLHYAVVSLVPLPWLYSRQTQGWKKMFYIDPDALLRAGA